MGLRLPTNLVLAAFAAFACGCDYTYTPSLKQVSDPVQEDSLVGEWTEASGGEGALEKPLSLNIVKDGGAYVVSSVPARFIEEQRVTLFRVEDRLLAEVSLPDGTQTIVAVQQEDGVLGVRLLSGKWADDHLVASRGAFTCTVKDSPKELLTALRKAGLEAFPGPSTLFVRSN